MNAFCAAIDWGTSQFRLWVLDEAGNVLAQRQSDEGLVCAGEQGFSAILEKHMCDMGLPKSVPVIICGMAGSQQGWQEAKYLETPVDLAVIPDAAIIVEGAERDVRILPGICQRDRLHPDVMRGEETQLLGAVNVLGTMNANPEKSIVCLPGTHSKWVNLHEDCIVNFSTHMTGDLFSAISTNTILRFGIDEAQPIDPTSSAFGQAVEQALNEPAQISSQLFAIRAAPLLNQASGKESKAQLSGALIGLELAAAISRHGIFETVTLIANAQLADLYVAAFDHCGINTVRLDGEHAARAGLFTAAQKCSPIAQKVAEE